MPHIAVQTDLRRAQEAARDIHGKLDDTTTYNVAHINKFIVALILLGMHSTCLLYTSDAADEL